MRTDRSGENGRGTTRADSPNLNDHFCAVNSDTLERP